MTARFLALYETPPDPESFDRHYHQTHIPLIRCLPGLRRYTLGRNVTTLHGTPCYLVAELEWDTMDELQAAFATPEGRHGRRCRTPAGACPGTQDDLHRGRHHRVAHFPAPPPGPVPPPASGRGSTPRPGGGQRPEVTLRRLERERRCPMREVDEAPGV